MEGVGGPGVPATEETDEPLIDLPVDGKPAESVKTSKVAGKRLKKAMKEVQALGGEADVGIDVKGDKE